MAGRPGGSGLRDPTDVGAYLDALAAACARQLGNALVGVYAMGSIALDDFQPATSDADVAAVTRASVPVPDRLALADAIAEIPCPVRGLEFVLYPRPALAVGEAGPAWDLNLNVGPRMAFSRSTDPATEPRHWFVLDLALAHGHARPLVGEPADAVFPPVPRRQVLRALGESLAWHATEDRGRPNAVLNACRAWMFVAEATLTSKTRAARWAADRGAGDLPAIALAMRSGQGGDLDPLEVDALVARVTEMVAAAS